MASTIDAINRSTIQACKQCGCADVATKSHGFCSTSCRNKPKADHTPETLMRRFWAKVDKSAGNGPEGDCWNWTARIDGRGYGEIKVAGKYRKAHRLALFGHADLDNPLFACHRCDNPLCVRPDHLFPGSPGDNVRDMHMKGRRPASRAMRGPTARKLTDEQVREIRATGISNRAGAVKYGVSPYTVNQVRRYALYKDVE